MLDRFNLYDIIRQVALGWPISVTLLQKLSSGFGPRVAFIASRYMVRRSAVFKWTNCPLCSCSRRRTFNVTWKVKKLSFLLLIPIADAWRKASEMVLFRCTHPFCLKWNSRKDANMVAAPSSELWTESQVADYLQVKRQTLTAWRHHGRHNLRFIKVGNSIRYRNSDVQEWLVARTSSST